MGSSVNQLPAELARHRVLDTAQSAAFCNFSVPHWRRLYRAGKVPPRVRLSSRKYGWRIGDLIDFIAASCGDVSNNDEEDAPAVLARSRGPPANRRRRN
jgi:predicted DNA-binding transcriptional regulator AlpA